MNKFSHISSAAFTDKGLVRGNNEDAVFSLHQDGVFGVSDGMGGGDAGELASAWIVEETEKSLSETADESPGLRLAAIHDALDHANTRIRSYAKEHNYQMMGATFALLAFNPWDSATAHVVHVGDSRIYRLRDGVLERLTADHTVGADIERMSGSDAVPGGIGSRLSHILTRAIGTADIVDPEMARVSVAPNDVFLICTDGVPTMLDDARLQELVRQSASPDDVVRRLSDAVRAAGAVDNYSIVVCAVGGSLPATERHAGDEVRESAYLEERWGK